MSLGYLPWEVPAPHGLQASFGPIIIKTRSSGGAHWPGKAFKMPVKQDRLPALKVNRLLQISQLLMEKKQGYHTYRAVSLWHFSETSKVLDGESAVEVAGWPSALRSQGK